mmetsp:Transcript_11945/g.27099  ORF Transcript_11945/g.27099 Transcript_11945/m.27099 type:complete len:83 (+) Transcript_11945:237-485(+)
MRPHEQRETHTVKPLPVGSTVPYSREKVHTTPSNRITRRSGEMRVKQNTKTKEESRKPTQSNSNGGDEQKVASNTKKKKTEN